MGYIAFVFRPRRSRNAAAYSHQTFPWTICRSVRLSVCLSSALWKNGGSDPDAVWYRRWDGSRDKAGGGVGDRSTVRGTFRGEFGARYGPRGPTGRTCATAPRRGPLAKVLWADLLTYQISKRCALLSLRTCDSALTIINQPTNQSIISLLHSRQTATGEHKYGHD